MIRESLLLGLVAMGLGCASHSPGTTPEPVVSADCCGKSVLDRGLEIAQRYRVAAITTRRFTHEQF